MSTADADDPAADLADAGVDPGAPPRPVDPLGPLDLVAALCDGVLFCGSVYVLTEALLLHNDGVFGGAQLAARVALCVPTLLLLAVLAVREAPDRKLRRAVGHLALAAFVPALLLLFVSKVQPSIDRNPEAPSAKNPLFLPIEWHKLPANIWAMIEAFPGYSGAITLAILVLFYLGFGRGWRRPVAAVFGVGAVLVVSQLLTPELRDRAGVFSVPFAGPLIMLAVATLRGWPRLFARASVVAIAFMALFGFYTALTPIEWDPSAVEGDDLTVLYPRPGQTAEIPTQYLRDVFVDEARAALYATFGPTSGLIRLDLSTVEGPASKLDTIITPGLYRYLRTTQESDEIYTVDWLYSELLVVDKDAFEVRERFPLDDGVLHQPIDLEVLADGFAVVSTELPAITTFDRAGGKREQIDFYERGLTKFKSGAWVVVRDPRNGDLIVHVGMIDASDRFALVRVRPDPLEVVDVVPIDAGGLTMIVVPEKGTLLLGDFYSRDVVELDLATLTELRRLRAGLNIRSLAYDPGRDLVYAASFLTGELVAIDYDDPERVVARRYVGKKPSGFYLSRERDALFFGSSTGILRVSLPELLGETG